MSLWGFICSLVSKLALVLALGVLSGCVSELPPTLGPPESGVEVGPTLDSPHVIRVCVKQPGVPRHKYFWAHDGSGRLVLDDWELGLLQRNGQRIYYFDENANPASAQLLPIPHNTLQCPEPTPNVLSSNGKVSPPKSTHEVQQAQGTAQTNTTRVAGAEPPACANTTEPGQGRRSRNTGTQTCVRTRTLRAPSRLPPAAVAKSEVESPALAQAVPEAAPRSPSLADWKVGAPNFSVPGLDPQRVVECVGSLCHARHPNFAPKGGKPAASGVLEQRSLSSGGAGGAKVTKGTTRKPPTGPKPVAKPATNPTIAPPQTTTTTVVTGKPSSITPAEARPGKPFRPRDKQQVIDGNRQRNDGATKCENCTVGTVPGQKSQKGITPPRNETQIDHKEPRSKGGSGTADNGQVLCRSCNREKSNK